MKQIKIHKYKLKQLSFNQNIKSKLLFGNFGLKSLKPGLITQKHLENLRRKLSKQFKKLNNIHKSKLFIRVVVWIGFTKKPMLSRMGKGSGVIYNWFALIRPGSILIEILSNENFLIISNIIKRAISSFPLKLFLIKKIL